MAHIQIQPDAQALILVALDEIIQAGRSAIAERGRFGFVLSGGSTPRPIYEHLAQPRYRDQIDWSRVHLFWGDERAVPPDHERSNYRMVDEAMLRHVPLPLENIHRIQAELAPEEAAGRYQSELMAYFGDAPPCFDLVLLGMGDDGHTASLFPGTAAVNEATVWAVAHHVATVGEWRITLTPAVLNQARYNLFVVSGVSKAAVLHEVLQGPYQPALYPSQVIQAEHGLVRWLVDMEAASRLV